MYDLIIMYTIIKCFDCGKETKAQRSDKKRCTDCYKNHRKQLRRLRDRNKVSKARYARYRNTDEYRRKARKRYCNLDENKRKARYFVSNAVRDGRLIRPKNCSKCHVKDWGVKRSMIEANHYRGYEKKYWLVVEWLCTNCHKKADNFI